MHGKLTVRSIESFGQVMEVRLDARCRHIAFGADAAACRKVVPAIHPTTQGYRVHWDAEAGVPDSTAGKSGVWTKVDVCQPLIIDSRQTEVRRPLMVVKPMTQQVPLVCFGSDRASAYQLDMGRVIPFESAPNGWNITVELDAPNDDYNK